MDQEDARVIPIGYNSKILKLGSQKVRFMGLNVDLHDQFFVNKIRCSYFLP